jgi:hypothetical protein
VYEPATSAVKVNVAFAEVTYDAAVTAENVNVISFVALIELAQVAAPVHEPEAVTASPATPVISAAASTAEDAGHAEGRTETVSVSVVAALVVTVTGTVIVETCPTTAVFAVAVPRAQVVGAAAFEGTDDKRPKPREATATSATRLKVVFVDICFLSISRVLEFPELGFG